MRTTILTYIFFGNTIFWCNPSLEKLLYGTINCFTVFYRFLFHSHFRDLSIWMEPNLGTGMPFIVLAANFIIYVFICAHFIVRRRYFKRLIFFFSILVICYWLICLLAFNGYVFSVYLKKNKILIIQAAHYFVDYLNLMRDLKNLIGVPKLNNLNFVYSTIIDKKFLHIGVVLTFLCFFYIIIFYKSETLPNFKKYQIRISSWNLISFLIILWLLVACSFFKSLVFIFLNIVLNYLFSFLLRCKNIEKYNSYFFSNKWYILFKSATLLSLLFIDLTNIANIEIKSSHYFTSCFIVLWYAYFLWAINAAKFSESPNTLPILWGVFVPTITLFCFLNILTRENLIAFVLFLIIIIAFFYKNISKTLSILPTYATERERKYLMFTAAKKSPNPVRLFNMQHYNDNSYLLMSKILTLSWLIVSTFLTIATSKTNFIAYCLVCILSVYPWFTFFASALINEEIKSFSVLSWRGMFVAKYQFHYICKYNACLIGSIYFVMFMFMFMSLYISPHPYLAKVIAGYIIMLVTGFTVIPFERPLTIWLKTQTYFRHYTYDYWTDEFWKLMSPLLRDYVYWKPIPPDDYEEERPYYLGMRYMYSTKIILVFLFLGIVLYTFVYTNSIPDLPRVALFWGLKLCAIIGYTWTLCRLFRYSFSKDNEAIYSYVATIRLVVIAWSVIYGTIGWYLLK